MRNLMMAMTITSLLALGCGGQETAGDAGSAPADPAKAAAAMPESAPPMGSALQITHLVEGSGASPAVTDIVQVHYHGTFEDGTVFDSSVERGEPAAFPLNRVIPCWTQGVKQMKVGGKAKLVCPPAIAYGARGAPPRIPPNSTLYFEVELLGIQ